MFDLGFLIFVGFICSIVGILLGVGLYRNNTMSEKQAEQLKQQLSDEKAKNDAYQQHVADHFSQTALMLNELTEKYKDIHQHLALGADQLCRDEEGHSLLVGSPLSDNINQANRPIQQPLDYAPKTNTTNSGTLSEDYGLEKVNLHEKPTEENNPPYSDGFESTDSEDDFSDPKIHAI
ncbi:MAG: DUF1043 family protein [Pseudomonadota bacterium]|nr:DUF1043 family protein [Pseudomonadota bacterium]